MWIDTHCHLQFDNVGIAALDRAVEAGVEKLICVGTDEQSSAEAIQIANAAGERVFATVGLHPHDAKNGLGKTEELLRKSFSQFPEKIVGIGECGLDYFYDHSPRNTQRDVFATQIAWAKEFERTLIIHTRDAWSDTFEILLSEGIPPRTVIHCFTGGPEEVRKALDLGLYISFSGIVTFKKSTDLQEAARICPIDRMTIETDSPFLAPVPHRGKTNEPAFLPRIGEFISDLKNVQVDEFSRAVYQTTLRVFNLR